EITGGGAPKAVNAAPGQATTTLKAVADGGRLATITGDPPREERGVAVSDVYVRPDGRQLSALAELLAHGTLGVPIASVRPLEQAAQALRDAVAGADGAIVLSLQTYPDPLGARAQAAHPGGAALLAAPGRVQPSQSALSEAYCLGTSRR